MAGSLLETYQHIHIEGKEGGVNMSIMVGGGSAYMTSLYNPEEGIIYVPSAGTSQREVKAFARSHQGLALKT